jgi:hypothetical protein
MEVTYKWFDVEGYSEITLRLNESGDTFVGKEAHNILHFFRRNHLDSFLERKTYLDNKLIVGMSTPVKNDYREPCTC